MIFIVLFRGSGRRLIFTVRMHVCLVDVSYCTHGIAKAFLSVCPSVCLSNAWIVTKRKNFVPTLLYHMRQSFLHVVGYSTPIAIVT